MAAPGACPVQPATLADAGGRGVDLDVLRELIAVTVADTRKLDRA
jgi:hypothetical protein